MLSLAYKKMKKDNPEKRKYRKVKPEDYSDIEEQYFDKFEKGKGGSSTGQKGKKTFSELKRQGQRSIQDEQLSTLEDRLFRVLDGLDPADEKMIQEYINWVNQSLSGGFTLNPNDREIRFSKSGGPGGQNVNKRETRVTLQHIPTRIKVTNDETRSQLHNRQAAERILSDHLKDHLNDWKLYLGSRPGTIEHAHVMAILMD